MAYHELTVLQKFWVVLVHLKIFILLNLFDCIRSYLQHAEPFLGSSAVACGLLVAACGI